MTQWQPIETRPIETAPKGGAEFQVWMVNDTPDLSAKACWSLRRMYSSRARFNSDGALEIWSYDKRAECPDGGWTSNFGAGWHATRWAPSLPEPPEES